MTKYYNKNVSCVAFILVAALCLSSQELNAESPDDIVVFVNNEMDLNELSINEVKSIFLGKKKRWPNGDLIIPINSTGNSAVRTQFRSKVLGMSATEEQTYWSNQRLRRQIQPPKEWGYSVKAVFRIKNAIGYAFRSQVPVNNKAVKVILVIPN